MNDSIESYPASPASRFSPSAYREQMLKTARSVSENLAEDWLHDALMTAEAKLSQFRGDTEPAFRAWLRTIVVNHCISKKRQLNNPISQAAPILPATEPGDPEHNNTPSRIARANEEITKLYQILDSLHEREREAVLYRYVDELPIKQIAVLMNTTALAVGGVLRRAMAKLRDKVKPEDWTRLV